MWLFVTDRLTFHCIHAAKIAHENIIDKGEVGNAILNIKSKTGFLFSQYAINIQVSTDCCGLICLSLSYNSHLTPVCLMHSQKRGKTILPFVFNMIFRTSPLIVYLEKEANWLNIWRKGRPMTGLELIMWYEGQWEASVKIRLPKFYTFLHCDYIFI